MAARTTSATRTTKKVAKKATTAARKTATAARKTTSAAKSTARKATTSAKKAARKSPSVAKGRATSTSRATSRNQGPDALRLLIEDHRTVEGLFKRFESLGSGAKKARQDVVARVIAELSAHAAIEEQAFYPAVRQMRNVEDDVLEALEEHHIVKWVLSELERMDASDERFEAKFTVLMENVRHHVEEEESDMFPKVRKGLSRDQLQTLGSALEEAKKTAPRRPHPRQPDTPPGNLIAAAVAGPIDAAMQAGENAVNQVRKLANRARR